MQHIVNIHQAKTNFSKLVDSARKGEETIIAKSGEPVAKLGPLKMQSKYRLGVLKGQIKMSDDFDTPLPNNIIDYFEK